MDRKKLHEYTAELVNEYISCTGGDVSPEEYILMRQQAIKEMKMNQVASSDIRSASTAAAPPRIERPTRTAEAHIPQPVSEPMAVNETPKSKFEILSGLKDNWN